MYSILVILRLFGYITTLTKAFQKTRNVTITTARWKNKMIITLSLQWPQGQTSFVCVFVCVCVCVQCEYSYLISIDMQNKTWLCEAFLFAILPSKEENATWGRNYLPFVQLTHLLTMLRRVWNYLFYFEICWIVVTGRHGWKYKVIVPKW